MNPVYGCHVGTPRGHLHSIKPQMLLLVEAAQPYELARCGASSFDSHQAFLGDSLRMDAILVPELGRAG